MQLEYIIEKIYSNPAVMEKKESLEEYDFDDISINNDYNQNTDNSINEEEFIILEEMLYADDQQTEEYKVFF